MNVGFGKIGKVLSFNKDKWSTSGGDYEPIVFIKTLAINNPQNTYYLLSKNNGYNNEIENLIDIWVDYDKSLTLLEWIDFVIPNLELNFIYVFGGPSSRASIPNVLWRKDKTAKRKIMTMLANYAAPILHSINIADVPYVYIATDIRHTNIKNEDLFVYPIKSYGQGESECAWKHIIDYNDLNTVVEKVKFEYYPFEKMRLLIEEKHVFKNISGRKGTIVLLNQGNHDYNRLNYILDIKESGFDCDVFGTWKTIKDEVGFIKDPIKPNDLNSYLVKYKYGLIYPLVNKQDWVTPKFYELIYNNIIPFIHVDYDIYNRLNVDEFFKFSNITELSIKIEYIESLSNSEYNLLLQYFHDEYLTDDLFNGSIIINFNTKIEYYVTKNGALKN